MGITKVFLGAIFVFFAAVNTFAETTETTEASEGDQAIVEAAQKLIQEGEAQDAKEKAILEAKESEIPVQIATVKKANTESQLIWRVVAGLGITFVMAGSMLYAVRRWKHRAPVGGKQARIEILHQLHLGPKKSLGLVRVSGETILIGITDQNINMLKPVTLIDDELEGIMKSDFNNFLEDEFSVEDVRSAIRTTRV